MKFLKVSSFYSEFVNFAKSRTTDLEHQPYEKQLDYLFSFGFGWSDFWKKHLEENAKASVTEILFNVEFLQKKWAVEQRLAYSENDWANDILEAQIAFYKPEVVFFEDYLKVPSYYKRKFPFIKFIASWDGLAYKDTRKYEGADLIASCHKGTVDYYNSVDRKSILFLFGFEGSLLEKLQQRTAVYNTSFVGSLNIYKNGHRERLSLLDYIDKKIPVDHWISGASFIPPFSLQMAKHIVRGMGHDAIKLNRLLETNRGSAFGLDMYQILSDSRITLNSHIDAAGPYAANIRMFEATGSGTCLLTDWKINMPELFDIEREVVVYKSKEECVEKIKWLLDHEDERARIASAGQKRTLENYSLKSRILGFIDHVSF